MNFKLGTRLWWGLPALLVLLWAAGLFTIKQYPGLATPPDFIMWALPSLRFARDVASILTVGSLLVGGLLLLPQSRRILNWAIGWALVWLVTLVVLLVSTVSEVTALTPLQALDPSIWWPFLTDTLPGRVFGLQAIGVVLVLALSMLDAGKIVRWISACIAIASALAPSFLGHGGFSTAHISLTISLAVHIAAASIWIGALAASLAYLLSEPSRAAELLPRLSVLALWCVIILGEAGLLNASLRVGSASLFVGTLYGSLVLIKAVLLGWLIRLGWLQRTRVVGQIPNNRHPLGPLGRFAAWEFTLMGIAVAVAIVLSRIGFDGIGSGDGSFTPLAILAIAVLLPALISVVYPLNASRALLRHLRSFPEIASVALLVVIAEVAGLGLLNSWLGVEFGVMVSSVLLASTAWLWCLAIDGPRRWNGLIVMMVGYPAVIIFVTAAAPAGSSWQLNLLSILVAEGVFLALAADRTPDPAQRAQQVISV
ncbi:MAG: CopD family protein [Actinomycetota bacterium]|nr:CopD family protein [Actinomycetota bacterium]